jgi:asparagine synthase (glutamine-hydrolysing)
MPGFVGFSHPDLETQQGVHRLRRMQSLISHADEDVHSELLLSQKVYGAAVTVSRMAHQQRVWFNQDIHVWLTGELYPSRPASELVSSLPVGSAEAVARLYIKDPTLSWLVHIEGFFAAALFDRKNHRLFLFTDRYGLRQLYYTATDGFFAWSTELKAFLAAPGFTARVDPHSIQQMMRIGYLLENRTYFRDVQLVPTGEMVVWDTQHSKQLSSKPYWWWTSIPVLPQVRDLRELAHEGGRLLRRAVEVRSGGAERIGLTLSGGQDSRALLAAIPRPGDAIGTFTFGTAGCRDIRYAGMAARKKGARHEIGEFTEANWLEYRTDAVWWTDGELDMQHMHGVEFRQAIAELFSVNLNGFAGDLIVGGSYLIRVDLLDRPLRVHDAAERMGCAESDLDCIARYQDVERTDVFFLQNRVRRFTYGGTKHSLTTIEHRKPFYDHAVIEFAYGLPDSLRFHGKLYRHLLLKSFPEFFRYIPVQRTGLPISLPESGTRAWISLQRRLARWCPALRSQAGQIYTNYPAWLRVEPGRSFLRELLLYADAIYPEYVNPDLVRGWLDEHDAGVDKSKQLFRIATIEVWLQQALCGRLRPKDTC